MNSQVRIHHWEFVTKVVDIQLSVVPSPIIVTAALTYRQYPTTFILVTILGSVQRRPEKTKFRSFEGLITSFSLAFHPFVVHNKKRSAQLQRNEVLKNEVCLDNFD